MPRKVPGLDPGIGDRPMTDAERQARHRAARAASAPVIRMRRPVDHRGRARRPDNLQDGATADALREICDLDLTELQAIDPPRGFGRD